MTETEWLTSNDARAMYTFIEPTATQQQLIALIQAAPWNTRENKGMTQEQILRDIFTPFVVFAWPDRRPSIHNMTFGQKTTVVECDPTWLAWNNNIVPKLAQAMRGESPDWSLMPILADALTESGCLDRHILDHCQEKRHTSHCWLISLLLPEHYNYWHPALPFVPKTPIP